MRKTVEDHKQELISALAAARNGILEAVQTIPPEQAGLVFLGEWCIKDLLAHFIGWDYTNWQAIQEIMAGNYPTFFQYYDKDWRSYNAELVKTYRKEDLASLFADAAASHQQFTYFLHSLPASDLVHGKARSVKGRTVTIRNLLLSEASDERKHAEQIQAFVAQLSRNAM